MSFSKESEQVHEIAIVGMSCRFPGAENAELFWQNLRDGVESITFFSEEELIAAGINADLLQHPDYIKASPVLENIEFFDAAFFRINPREAEIMDPQQRIFLECAWEALENAGYDPERYDGRVGVYGGSGMNGYLLYNLASKQDISAELAMTVDKDYLSTRVSYKLNLTGPSLTVQTACSTALVATHLACESLLNGECDMALAGSIAISIPMKTGYLYTEGLFSPDGHCRAFDAQAQGTIFGSGVGLVVLKRLEDALADGDCIHAVIKGWAINNDGGVKAGYTAPGVDGQAAVIAEALDVAGVDPENIAYIETHGSGTALGDPIEVAAMTQAFRLSTQKRQFCAIGSVKTNVGHLGIAAGAAGLIKTVLALKHKQIPASLNFQEANPHIDFTHSPFYVNTKLREWPTVDDQPRQAGVSSFGMGGTNAHVVLEEAPEVVTDEPTKEWQLLLLSAQTATAVEQATHNLATYLQEHEEVNLADVAYTLQVGRKVFENRRMVVCRGREDALAALTSAAESRMGSRVQGPTARPLVFMFPGVGDHYVHMAQELYEREPLFRQTIDSCSAQLRPILGGELREMLYPAGQSSVGAGSGIDLRQMLGRDGAAELNKPLQQTKWAQPAVFVVEYALAQLLRSWGIEPDALIGYSLGEYVAACVAGVMSLEDGAMLVAKRAEMIEALPAGSMLAVSLSAAAVQEYLGEGVCLAVVNGPGTCVLGGPEARIAQVEATLSTAGIGCRRLETSHAFHTTMMAPMVEAFTALVARVRLHKPTIPYLSNVTGTWITASEATDPHYWARHLCQTVQFGEGLAELLAKPQQILLEVGPGQTLGSFAKQHPRCQPEQIGQILATVRYAYDRQSDEAFLLGALGKLWLTGYTIDWAAYYGRERRQRLPLPTYPFERQRYWVEATTTRAGTGGAAAGSTGKRSDIGRWFYEPVWQPTALASTAGAAVSGKWLIFTDAAGWGAALSHQLSRQGATVIQVQSGAAYATTDAGSYTIRPEHAADYVTLLDHLEATGQLPEHIVHLWSVGHTPTGSAAAFQATQQLGFYSLLYLAQAIGQRKTAQPLQITLLTNDMQPVKGKVIYPEKSTVLGLCHVIPQEYQNIRCRALDITLPLNVDVIEDNLLTQLIADLTTPITDVTIAYRTGTRYVQQFVPHRLPAGSNDTQLREGGVYLITGGLGGVGLTLARYLAQRFQARLTLTGRSGLPSREVWDDWLENHPHEDATVRKIQAVRSLESLGAEVLVIAADVSNEEQMQAAIAQTLDRFANLNGVIHAAGLTDKSYFQPIQDTHETMCETHFLAKAYGLYVLDKVLQDRALDFCMLFSSVSSVLGGLGFAAYAAANNFMDSYTHKHNHTTTSNWISVNWDTWGAAQEEPQRPLKTPATEFEMSPAESVEAFTLAVGSSVAQLVNSTGDLEHRIRQWVFLEALKTETQTNQASYARPALNTTYVPASNDYEKKIAAIWQEVLGINKIGIHDNFFDLGGNSLIGLQVISQIRKVLECELSTVALFEAPTVSALAKYLQPDVVLEKSAAETAVLSQRRRKAQKNVNHEGIAIIAMTGRFPGAESIEKLWDNLCNGVESLTVFTDEELLATGLDPEFMNTPDYVKARPILKGIDLFDAGFFGYSPREAEVIDPQHRLFLECAWEAVELAGYNTETYKGLIGVFAGESLSAYLLSWITDPKIVRTVDIFQAMLNSDKDSLTTSVSYKMNLRGPSFAVQTFCSTSLVATHIACQSLLNGECDMALAGGVTVHVPPGQGYLYKEGGIMSPDGHCRTFDAKAQGSMFGDGVGVVVLKRLEDALEDGDTIHAVIRGSAVNNDGSLKAGYTAPSVVGQADAVTMALENAAVDPQTIGYIEAHGTATELGDPIEIASLTQAFRQHTKEKGYCAIGSIKTNIGHLDRAAGVAGLIKAVLAVKHGVIPPSLYFETPNPQIDFANSPFFVNTKLSPWPQQNGNPRRAGVNALGVGGTNAHAIVEEPPVQAPSGASRPWQLLLLSAKTESALDMATANLAHYLRENPDTKLADIAYTLQVGRRAFAQRRMVVCQGMEDALHTIESVNPHRVLTHYQPAISRPITFMFPGVGDHYLQMARELYESETLFRDTVEQCCQILYPYLDMKVRDLLYPADEPWGTGVKGSNGVNLRAMLNSEKPVLSPAAQRLNKTSIAQPVVFVIEYALAHLLMSWGIRPQAMVGYSLGEYTAACLSGVLSLKDALKLIAVRAQMIESLPPGNMVAVSLSKDAIEPWLSEEVSLAIHHGETSCVLAGTPEGIKGLEAQLIERGIAYRLLNTSHAFHSSTMVSLMAPLTELAQTVKLNPPRIPYLSNVTGTWITAEQATDPGYWAEHMCQPVQFFDALTELLKEEDQILLEVGPGQSLGSFAKLHPDCASSQIQLVLSTMRYAYDSQPDQAFLLSVLGKLWLLGAEPDWSGFYEAEQRCRIPLPTYPFERQRYWMEPRKGLGGWSTSDFEEDPASLPRKAADEWFYLPVWSQTPPRLPSLPPMEKADASCWLLFQDAYGLGEQAAQWLADRKQHVVTVRPGASFQQVTESQYIIQPRSPGDYVELLSRLEKQGWEPTKVVHLWSVTADEVRDQDEDFLEQTLDVSFYSLMFLAQALGGMASGYQLSVVTSHVQPVIGNERIIPEKTTVIGPCKVIPQEYARVTCQCIDVVWPGAGSWQAEALLVNLLGELTADVSNNTIALRGHQRWVQNVEPIPLPKVTEQTLPQLRPQGVYLVTGGLGGIGLAMAEYLAQTTQAKLILTGRSGLPAREKWEQILAADDGEYGVGRKIRCVQQLESLGAEVLVVAADVADEQQMKAAVDQAVARFGTIHGIVHAAGVPGVGLIQLKTVEAATAVLAPKVMGTLIMDRLLQNAGIDIDFLVLFSSVSSFMGGGVGQIDYCAANAFLDGYAQRHMGSKRQVTSINWGEWKWNAWEEGLDGFDAQLQESLREGRERFGIGFEEGQEAFARILSSRQPQVIVSTQDFRHLVEASRHYSVESLLELARLSRESRPKHPRPALGTSYAVPGSDLEQKIADIWSNLLGITEIGVNDNFFDLGGNSLIGIDLISRLQKELNGVKIFAHTLYEAPTVGLLARFIDHDQQPEDDFIAQQQARGAKHREKLKQRQRGRTKG